MCKTEKTKIQQLNIPGVDVQDAVEQLLSVLLVVEAHFDPVPVPLERLVGRLEGGLRPVSEAMAGVAKLLLPKYKCGFKHKPSK